MSKKKKKLEEEQDAIRYFGSNVGQSVIKHKMKSRNGLPSQHYFTKDGLRHGEYLAVSEDGRFHQHAFFIEDIIHGAKEFFNPDSIATVQMFYVRGNTVNDVPFLPPKPDRIPHNSGRTRIDTLEF